MKIFVVYFNWMQQPRIVFTRHLANTSCLLGISFENCRGQAYDGTLNFQGHITGVAKRFQSDNPAAISTHCLAHCVNLCLQDIGRNIKSIKEALNFSTELIQLIKYSPKRQVVFEKIQSQQDNSSLSRIRTFCPS